MLDDLQLYTNAFDNGTVRYGFGEPWVATAMLVDDYGFPTEEEAVLDWYYKTYHKEKRNDSSDYNSAY